MSRNPRAIRLATAMKLARGALGISQAELARRINYPHKSDIGAWETGARFPAKDVLQRIDDELNQDGHLMRIAGYTLTDNSITDEIRAIIDHHVVLMLADIDRLLNG